MQTNKQKLEQEKKTGNDFIWKVKYCHFCGSKSIKHFSSWGRIHKFNCYNCNKMNHIEELTFEKSEVPIETFDLTIKVYNKLKRNDINTSDEVFAFLRNCRLGDDLKSDFVWKGEELTEKNMKEIYENMKRGGYL